MSVSPKSASNDNANAFFRKYLKYNVVAANTLEKTKGLIGEFSARAPSVAVWKCVDGRMHGSKAKGYPPTTITMARTDGANIDVSIANTALWDRINAVVSDAKRRTPGKPAIFFAFAHRSDHAGYGCAAHGGDDEKALQAVLTHTGEIREQYRKAGYEANDLYAIAGITNTDDMSERLHLPDGSVIGTADIIAELGLHKPSDVFSEYFLTHHIADEATRRHVGNKTPLELLNMDNTALYRNLETTIAMESFLLRAITEIESKEGRGAGDIVNTQVFETVYHKLNGVKDLPPTLKGALLYQFIWNMAYALYQRNRIAGMNEEEQRKVLDHSETLVCYGEGYETLTRNKCILVKPGRGNDIEALKVAAHVLGKNRTRMPQDHPPLVHVNVEVPDAMNSWDAFNWEVEAKLMTRRRTIYEAFGDDVRMLGTYSYRNGKAFYPVRVKEGDPRECYDVDLTEGMTTKDFSQHSLKDREFRYTQRMLADNADTD